MATIKVLSSGAFQIRVVSKLLPKPYYATFQSREDAVAFSDRLQALLKQGIIAESMREDKGVARAPWSLKRCIAEYVRSESVPVSEMKLLDTLRDRLADIYTNGE
jgi:hypothetical protein